MKMWKKVWAFVFAAVLICSLCAGDVQAAASGYTYTVTIYAGNQGDFEDIEDVTAEGTGVSVVQSEKKIVISGLQPGAEIGFMAQDAVVMDAGSKYYVKGIRLSGRDNGTVDDSVFIVNEDTDYVVAYGIKGNQVSYTVKYQDANGKELAASDVFYGNVGDKPVVAYKYISGYAPKALGLTKTLSADASENIFTFVYIPVPTPTVNDVVTEEVKEVIREQVIGSVIIAPGGSQSGAGTAGGAGQAGAETDTDNGETGEEAGGEGTQDGTETTPEDDQSGEEEDVIIDLDEEDTPLADTDPLIEQQKDMSMLKYIGLITAGVLALILLFGIALIMKKREKKENEES